MKTTTITEKFDDEGRLTERTVVVSEAEDSKVTPSIELPSACTCFKMWGSILPPPPCPVHGQGEYIKPMWADTWTINTPLPQTRTLPYIECGTSTPMTTTQSVMTA